MGGPFGDMGGGGTGGDGGFGKKFKVPNPFEGTSGGHGSPGGGGDWRPFDWAKGKWAGWAGGGMDGILKKAGDFLNPQGDTGFASAPELNKVDFANKLQAMVNAGPESAMQNQYIRDLGVQTQTGGPQAQIAQNQLNQATDQNIAQNAGFMSSQKGVNPALAARMSGQNAAMMNQQAAGQAQNMKLASMLGAQQQYGQALNDQVQNDNQWMNILSQGNAAQNQALNTGGLGAQDINAQIAIQNLKGRQGMAGGLMNGAGGAITQSGIFGKLGNMWKGGAGASPPSSSGYDSDGGGADVGNMALYFDGGFIPGKAEVPGDSPANDTKEVLASPGEIFVPRSASHSPEAAKSFIDELFKRQKKTSYADVLRARRDTQAFNCGGMAYAGGGMVDGEWRALGSRGAVAAGPEDNPMTSWTRQKQGYADGGMVNPQVPYSIGYQPTPMQEPPRMSWREQAKAPVEPKAPPTMWSDPEGAFAAPQERAQVIPHNDEIIRKKEPVPVTNNPNLEYKTPVTTEDKARSGEMPAMGMEQQPGYAKTVAGIQAQAKAAEDYYKQAHEAYQAMQAKQDAALNEYKRGYKEIDDESARLRKDIETQQVDPSRVWSNMTTGGKVMSGIGVLLAGIGSGLTGQPNAAMKLMDDAISRDIDAQKAELGKKESLLSRNMQRYGNLEDAYAATKAQMIAVSQAQIADAAAKMNSTEAKGKAQQMIGQLEQQRAQIQQSVALGRLRGQALPPELAEKMAPGQWVQMPDGSARIAQTKEGAQAIRKSMAAMEPFKRTVAEMRKLSEEEGGIGTMPGSKRNAEAKSLMAQAKLQLKDIGELGVLSESDFEELVNPMIPHPGSFFSSNAQAQLDQLEKFAQSKVDATMQANLQGYQPMQAKSGDIPLQ